jgi:polyisoprenoid-binding protein YceI
MSNSATLLLRSLPAVALFTTSLGWAAEYQVDREADNRVVFTSDAPIEDFQGTTGRIDGYVVFDGDSLAAGMNCDSSSLFFEVDLASLDTGIGLRNRHMRENYLETDKFAYASFLGRLTDVDLCGPDSSLVRASGTMSIHGVSNPFEVGCTLVPTSQGYRVQAAFVVRLSDYEIDVPSLMFMKISEDIALRLDFVVARPETMSAR